MSIGGILRTSVSGMNAQATRLSTVSENIANSDTTGYKRSDTQFSSLILPASTSGYNSGAVEAQVRALVSEQGGISYTGNDNNPKSIDLAIQGNGFLAVGDGSGGTYLTRAGSFTQVPNGTLVNAAGYVLQGYPVDSTGVDSVLNGFQGLVDVNLATSILSATPSTSGSLTFPLNKDSSSMLATYTNTSGLDAMTSTDTLDFTVTVDGVVKTVSIAAGAAKTASEIVDEINTDAGAVIASLTNGKLTFTSTGSNYGTTSTLAIAVTSNTAGLEIGDGISVTGAGTSLPSTNTATALDDETTTSTSMTVYNNSGEAVKLDIYFTKIADEKWEVAIFDSRNARSGTTSPFPYGTSGSSPLATATLGFDASDGYILSSITAGTNTTDGGDGLLSIDLSDIDGDSAFSFDISKMTQLTGDNQPTEASADGTPPEVVKSIAISTDGMITATYDSGTTKELFKVPLALVAAPNSLTPGAGNVYSVGIESGTILMGFGGSDGFGTIKAGALEESTVDLASELTTMIESQRSYTANSKVFQTGSEILDVLVNLKR